MFENLPLPMYEDVLRETKEVLRFYEQRGDVDLVGKDVTCFDCVRNPYCEYAWDVYNTFGDCLWLK